MVYTWVELVDALYAALNFVMEETIVVITAAVSVSMSTLMFKVPDLTNLFANMGIADPENFCSLVNSVKLQIPAYPPRVAAPVLL